MYDSYHIQSVIFSVNIILFLRSFVLRNDALNLIWSLGVLIELRFHLRFRPLLCETKFSLNFFVLDRMFIKLKDLARTDDMLTRKFVD